MNTKCRIAFEKAKELINRNKEHYGDKTPNIQPFDDGNIFVQYFDKWDTFIGNTKIRETNLIGDNEYISDVKYIFTESGYYEKNKKYQYDQTYIIVNGSIEFKFDDDSIKTINSNEIYHVPKEKSHSILCVRDTYVLVIVH